MRYLIMLVVFGLTNIALAEANLNKNEYGKVSLQVEVTRKVSPDLMQVTLFTEEQGKDQTKVAQLVTERLNKATNQARELKDKINIKTGERRTYPIYKDKSFFGAGDVSAWRERAVLHLESKDFAVLSKLTAQLLNDLAMENITFALSNNARLKLEEELSQEAARNFMQRAKSITNALGAKKFKLLSLDLTNNQRYVPVPVMRNKSMAMSASADMAEVNISVEAGVSDFIFTARGYIVLD